MGYKTGISNKTSRYLSTEMGMNYPELCNLKRNTHNAHRVIHKYTGYTLKTGINVRKISKLQKYWYNKREQCEQVNNLWITGELITIWRTKRHENHHFSYGKLKRNTGSKP